MMSSMQQVSKRQRVSAGPTEEFVGLCKALYGDFVDPEAIWSDVVKLSPDQADVHANNGKLRRNVERGSNAVGIAAGSLGLAGALKDDRLKDGGRLARRMYATGEKMPKVLGRIKSPKVQAGLAAGAVATQVANLGGDGLIAGTLSDGSKKKDRVRKAALAPSFGMSAETLATKLKPTGVKAPIPAKAATPPKAAATPKAAEPTARSRAGRNARRDMNASLGTTTGKVTAGVTAATLGAALKPKPAPDPYAPYGKSAEFDLEVAGTFSKFDDAKKQAFGWASVVAKNGQPVIDQQGDFIGMEDLAEAAYTYVHKSRVGGDMHRRDGASAHKVSDMIESMVFTPEKIAKMGLPDDFPQGWWVGYQIHDDATWDLVRKRGRTGFSIHGRGVRRDADVDQIMGYTA